MNWIESAIIILLHFLIQQLFFNHFIFFGSCSMVYVSVMEYFEAADLIAGDLDFVMHQIEGTNDLNNEFGDNQMGSQVLIDIFSLFLLGDDEMNRKEQQITSDGASKIVGADGFRIILPTNLSVCIVSVYLPLYSTTTNFV